MLIFNLDSNLRIDSLKDSKGSALTYYQSREGKDRFQSYGDYVAVVLAQPLQPGEAQSLEFHYPPEFDSLAKCLNITRGLVARGYDDKAARAILGDNLLRVFEQVLGGQA